MTRANIQGVDFELFYDYDRSKLNKLDDNGLIEWFRLRMDLVFLEPIKQIFDKDTPSDAYKALHTDDRTFVIAAFSVLLNGLEALGSFLTQKCASKKDNFYAFLRSYMQDWDKSDSSVTCTSGYLPEILWKHYRNGIAHGFVIECGGLEYSADATKWQVNGGQVKIGPTAFFNDFLKGVSQFFDDVKDPSTPEHATFLARFKEVYPS